MDEKIDKLIDLCGTKNKYQFILLGISFICWANNMLTAIGLPFLEKVPEVSYISSTGVEEISLLNYTICEWDKSKYKIHKSFDYSWVIQTDIICDQIKTGLLGSATFTGNFCGSILFNLVVDSFGRKKTFLFSIGMFCIFNTSIIFFTTYYPIIIFNFLLNIFAVFTNYSCLLLTEEVTSVSYRGIFGTIINAGFPSCALIYFPLFNFLGKWQYVFAINSGLAGLMLVIFLIYSYESPRYYISKGEVIKAIDILKEIAKFHKLKKNFTEKIESDEYKEIISIISKGNNELLEEPAARKKRTKVNAFALIKYPSIRYKFLILCYLGFCISGSYNGISISIKNLPGDIYINGMLFYSFEVFVGFISGCIINTKFFGRKGTILTLYFISFVSFLLFLFCNFEGIWKIIVVLFLKFSISGIFSIIYTYFLENYPTCIRALGFGINTSFDNIGGMVFPMVTELLSEKNLFLTLAIMNLTQFILMLFMPETNGLALPETIKELEEKEEEDTEARSSGEVISRKIKIDQLVEPLFSNSMLENDKSKTILEE